MFTHNIQSFGAFEKHIFSNSSGDAFEVTPQYGACLLDLRFGGMSVLDGYKTPEDLIANKWSKNIILAPFPNRLANGTYTHLDKTYQFPLNNAATNNAIHGFCKDVPMTVIATWHNENEGGLTCRWQDEGTHQAYPFRFTLEVTMILRGGAFEMKMGFKNDDTEVIPVGMGWHPYFIMSNKSNETSLQMPYCQRIIIDEKMLPTGKISRFTRFQTLKKIKKIVLDNGFKLSPRGKIAETILQSERGKLTFWQEKGAGKWNFLQVFTPPHRKSIAIEPMTCNIDAFNNNDGLTWLEPTELLEGRFGVRFEK